MATQGGGSDSIVKIWCVLNFKGIGETKQMISKQIKFSVPNLNDNQNRDCVKITWKNQKSHCSLNIYI